MKYLFFIAFVITVASCGHSTTGSGNIVSEKRTTASFMAVHAGGSVHVTLKNGATQSVTVEADDNIISYVETKVSGNTLDVRLRGLNNLSNVTVNVVVVSPTLKEVSASASADIDARDVIKAADNILLKASSSAKVTASVDAPSITAEATSSGNVVVSGRTKSLITEASSSGSVKAFDLKAENATASASSSGDIEIFGSVSINAAASSSGEISYKGGATQVVKKESSSGSVEADD